MKLAWQTEAPAVPVNNVFLLPDEADSYVLYAPLAGVAARLNAAAAKQVAFSLSKGDSALVDSPVSSALGGIERLRTGSLPPARSPTEPFRPEHLTIFPSNGCNLRCAYCYASAGDSPIQTIESEFVEAALDLVKAAVSSASSERPVPINFHGGGEPLMRLSVVSRAVEAARMRFGTRARFTVATNGVLDDEQRDFLVHNFHGVNISLDGPADIQDSQRPQISGKGSFERVMCTIEVLRSHEIDFSVRTTVTAGSLGRLLEIAEFMVRQVGCKVVAFEPAFLSGRCELKPAMAPDPDAFITEFIRAHDYCAAHDVVLRYSGARPGAVADCFCSVARDSFSITPDGYVTSCFEVCHGRHRFAPQFVYGQYEAASKAIVLDMNRLARLRGLVVGNRRECDGCFCRWHCAGDCAVKVVALEEAGYASQSRCKITQALTLHMIKGLLDGRKREPALTPSPSRLDAIGC